ncbi:MAG: 2-amino-4-hydroxy-6-hydroxymethyldihydropteridine diphosphokinase [Chitinophagaceae bacterium]
MKVKIFDPLSTPNRMNRAYLLTGGNLGKRWDNLHTAFKHISDRCGQIVAKSAIYETAAWGKQDQQAFLNQVLVLETSLAPEVLMQTLLEIEQTMGRIREEKYGPRIIDIDILFIDDQILNTPLLQLPHPAITQRRFVLVPLQELAPDFIHPVYQQTISHLLEACPDHLDVKKFSPPAQI